MKVLNENPEDLLFEEIPGERDGGLREVPRRFPGRNRSSRRHMDTGTEYVSFWSNAVAFLESKYLNELSME